MLKRIFSLLAPASETPEPDRIPLATAVLLLELAHSDGEYSSTEQKLIADLLETQFQLTPGTRQELLELAQKVRDESFDLHQFTSQINHNFSQPEKEQIIQGFWRLAFADGRLDAQEETMLRQLANLIGLSHRQMINAKLAVKQQNESCR